MVVSLNDKTIESAWSLLGEVMDPEVPVLSIIDLGIVRNIESENDQLIVTITPTYSGCPAMDVIAMSIRINLAAAGYSNIRIEQVLSPAWTTDWMTDNGRQKLKEYGIAPPN